MDLPSSQQQQARRRNLQHLSLGPLTTRLPLRDDLDLATDLLTTASTPSYLQGRSAPVTPRLLSTSPPPPGLSRSRSHDHSYARASRDGLSKSLSTTHLFTTTTTAHHHQRRRAQPSDRPSNRDWLLRAGAIVASETREFKGQTWLAARASSTSLTALHDHDHDHDQVGLAASPLRGASRVGSRLASRAHSRAVSRTASRVRLLSALDDDDHVDGPDFVNLDDRLESLHQDTTLADEEHVRRLVRREKAAGGVIGSWLGTVFGWPLFFVHDDDDDDNDDDDDDDDDDSQTNDDDDDDDDDNDDLDERTAYIDTYSTDDDNVSRPRCLEGESATAQDYVPPPPQADGGGWHDAAWLLNVAAKVLL